MKYKYILKQKRKIIKDVTATFLRLALKQSTKRKWTAQQCHAPAFQQTVAINMSGVPQFHIIDMEPVISVI